MLRGQPYLSSQTTQRTFERCQTRDNTKDAIIIDDDIENVDVVLLDNPNISHHGPENAKTARLNCLPRGVICIDDEEEDIRNSSGDTTSNQFGEEFSSLSSSEDSDSDECIMFVGNGNIYHDHTGPSRNRYGLGLESECSTAESTSLKSSIHECDDFEVNSSDCEIIEDHSGNIRELWEKAASRKKDNDRFASSDQATASGSTANPEDSSNAPATDNADTGNCSDKVLPTFCEEMLAESCSFSPHNAEESPTINVFSTDEHETIHFKTTVKTTVNISAAQSGPSSHIPREAACNWKKDEKSNPEKCSQTAQSMDDGLSFLNKDEQVPMENFFFVNENGKTSFSDIEEPCSRTSSGSLTSDGKQVSTDNIICQDKMEKILGKVSYNTQPKYGSVSEHEAPDFKESKKRDSENALPFCSEKDEEPLIYSENSDVHGNLGVSGDDKVGGVFVKSDVGLTSQNEPDDMPHGYKSLICERERHKETDEYRRAAEEEWASRQRQLQIQAEEAQRMRKRRKAENLRLLEMEKRQKQRVEEVRELQKKDEKTTQLKEQIRTEVRKELERVEMKYRDMASVLRALGIHVKGGHFPMLHEVNAAYKQALLRFHPDRASRTDIRQQVEAEEKFKLISRLKEKLLP